MPIKKEVTHDARRQNNSQGNTAPDDFPSELLGEFATLPSQTVQNVGTIAGLAVGGGGYFGLSVTDDGGSVRLAIRHGSFVLDKRFYGLTKFEGALAYCLGKLRDADGKSRTT